MSAAGAVAGADPVAGRVVSAPRRSQRAAPAVARAPVIAFAAVALLAALRFGALLAHPPVWRTLAMVASATLVAGVLHATQMRPREPLRAGAIRVAAVTLGAWLTLCAAGARVSWPAHSARLVGSVSRGLDGLDGRWPYRGAFGDARLTVMLGAGVALIAAAALCFWPARSSTAATGTAPEGHRAGGPARRRSVAGLALLLTLYTTAAVNESTAGWPAQGLLLAGAAWLWVWAWWRPERPTPARSAAAQRAAGWIAVASFAALLATGALRSHAPLVDYRAWNPFAPAYPAAVFNWNQQYGPLDQSQSSEVMFDVSSATPNLWRVTTLDRFDGVGFVRSASPPGTAAAAAAAGSTGGRGAAAGRAAQPAARTVSAQFKIAGLRSAQLVSPGQAVSARIDTSTAARPLPIAADGTLAVTGGTPATGDRYEVTALVVSAAPTALRRAPRTFAAAYLPYTQFVLPGGEVISPSAPGRAPVADVSLARRLSGTPYAAVFALARTLGAGASSGYDVVSNVERYLDSHETYSLTPPRSAYPLVSFLLASHIGYCQQFSGAMALLLRMNGIPARVVAGFQTGARAGADRWRVTGADAHEWVEVYFSGVGWVAFDPTPPASAGGQPSDASPAVTRSGATPVTRAPRARSLVRRRDIGNPPAAAATHRSGSASGVLVVAGLAVTAIVLAAVLALALAWALTVLRDRALDAGGGDVAAGELARALSRVGPAPSPATTLAQLERGLAARYGPAAGEYAALLHERRYGRRGTAGRPSAGDRRRLRRTLATGRGAATRVRLLVALPPAIVVRLGMRRGAAARPRA